MVDDRTPRDVCRRHWPWRSPATPLAAQTIADDLDSRFPEDTSVRFNYVPTLRALAALRTRTIPSRAIELLRPAATYEFAQPGISFYGAGGGGFGAMYPTYVRGMAYLALHKPAEAAAEFQKILDHPGVVLEDPMGALARLQLARAWTMAGDVGKAKTAYEELLRLWKDADPAIPCGKRSPCGIRQVAVIQIIRSPRCSHRTANGFVGLPLTQLVLGDADRVRRQDLFAPQ